MRFLIALASLLLSSGVIKANPIKALGYEINYSAFSAKQIDKDLIKRHRLGFSEQDIVVNINISPNRELEKISVDGSGTSLLGAIEQISFKKILEKGKVFYLGAFKANEDDFLSFNIEITLPNQEKIPIKFVRRYD